MSQPTRPRFSLVSAVYDVARYLPEFIASIEAQTHPLDDVEVILIDDGSTDDSPRLLAEWAARRPELVRVVTQANAGQGAARNAGIAAARGEWVTFPDPDDALAPGYLAAVAGFLDREPDVELVAANRWIWDDETGKISNTHPLRFMFRVDRRVDLVADGQHFQGSAPAAFFRLDRLRELDLSFDSRVRPIFEDGHFTCRYLIGFERPAAGFVGSAHYHYRKRSDGSSTLQTARAHSGRYTDVLQYGYLDVVHRALERHGTVPSWLQSHLVFDLSWYFTRTDSRAPLGTPLEGPVADFMHQAIAEILGHLDLETAVTYISAPVAPRQRLVLKHGYAEAPWHEPFVTFEEIDPPRQLAMASWFFTGPAPREEFRAEGQPIEPLHIKTRDYTYCGRTLLRQRIAWLPADMATEVLLDGKQMDIYFRRPTLSTKYARPGLLRWHLSETSGRVVRMARRILEPRPTSRTGRVARRLSRVGRVRERYRDAWVLMDRIHNAGDSAEVLFRYIVKNHPELNAWFVLEKGTPEWERLSKEGFSQRLVPHGSMQWRLLMANAAHLISSHADEAVLNPPAITEFTVPRWKNHFLQHGLIKDDLSGWLNRKELSTFVTSSQQEYASIAGDHTPYKFSTREVVLTGMPRFDQLLATGRRFPPERRDLLLVTPTWRNGLVPALEAGSQRRQADPALLDSDFFQQWLGFLKHPALAALCAEQGLTLGFLPHPNLQEMLPLLDLPEHVRPLTYEGHDVQEYFARARLLVTDFSSIAFNAAYLERPVVYFQFDEDVVLGGGHVGRAGYFDYRRDGFGPVETTAAGAIQAVRTGLEAGPAPAPAYQARIDATFPSRDGRCCERVVAAVRATTEHYAKVGAVPTPLMPAPIPVPEVS